MPRSNSSAESYFFKLLPNYFKADYGFAKNMKPNTAYRLVLFKGIMKTDEMSHPMRGKLVGGKISFNDNTLSFYLPIFSPLRNIEFTIKVMAAVGSEEQSEIAFHKIKSGDYIKQLRSEGTHHFNQQVQLLDSFSLAYDLFVHHSKAELEEIVKFHREKPGNYPFNIPPLYTKIKTTTMKKSTVTEYFSQCDWSQTSSVHREDSICSVKKKLTRKRGHDGALKRVQNAKDKDSASERSLQLSQKMKGGTSQQNEFSFLPLKHIQSHKRSQSDRYMLRPFKYEEKEEESAQPKKEVLAHQRSTPKFKEFMESKESIMDCIKIQTIDTLNKQSEEVFKNYDSLQSFKKQPITKGQWYKQTFSKDLSSKKTNSWQKQSFGKIVPLKVQTVHADSTSIQCDNQKEVRKHNNTHNTNNSFQQKQVEIADIRNRRDSLQIPKKLGVKKIFSLSEEPMKLSYRTPSQYDQSEDQAPRQFQSIKKRVFYVVFFIISALLFFNALLPSRKK